MRWPLRNQILLRMLLLLFLAIFTLTFANIRSIIAESRKVEDRRLQKIADMVSATRFPLSSSVLENMALLSGAEFHLQDGSGVTLEKTNSAPNSIVNNTLHSPHGGSINTLVSGDQAYLHTVVETSARRGRAETPETLHIFVPKKTDTEVWWHAGKTPITIAILAIPVTFLISWALANQVTQPLAKLGIQVQQIAGGDLHQIPETPNKDEIRELGNSINQLAVQLEDHDQRLRKNERLKNVVQFGSSIAHHLRNMTTGCKLAIELLAVKHSEIESAENFQVATQQLELMESYIKKFLLLSKSQDHSVESKAEPIDLNEVLQSTLFLLRPNANHLGVEMNVDSKSDRSLVLLAREDAEQMMMNLISNAIEAASHGQTVLSRNTQPTVSVELAVEKGQFKFSVIDNGDGPPQEIGAAIFQPFVTGKKEGTGLGLAVVQDVANRLGGSVRWNRQNEKTIFTLQSNPSI